MSSKYSINVAKDAEITNLKMRPDDYHCTCEYCSTKFLGEIYDTVENKYYTQAARNKYMPNKDNEKFPHNNPGQWVGYRFAIQKLTKLGDLVFDPTVGTGTAIVEAENNGRKGIGIEIEFPETTKYFTEGKGVVIEGNALKVKPKKIGKKESIQLIVNGTPYPVISGNISSDAPMALGSNSYGDYKNSDNIGKWKVVEFSERIHELYSKFIPLLKPGGYLCIIIKDPTNQKKPYNLHKMIADSILKNNKNMKAHSYFIHRHIPPTMFMNTYESINGIPCPVWHQTGIILRKEK